VGQTPETSLVEEADTARPDWRGWVQVSLLAILLFVLYHRIVVSLVVQWWTDPNYSHGFLVPFFCGWMVWKERRYIADVPVRPSWLSLSIILFALGILVLGVLGAENFLSRTSFLFLIAGLILFFRGRQFFRAVLFPWATLFLMVPLPAILFNQIALPLQFQASRLASSLLALVGVPVLREGNIIHLPSLTLDVVEACSGLRSLASLLTLAVFYGYFFERRVYRRVLLILVAVPIAVVANGVRIMGSGILGQYWNPESADGFFHFFSGWLIFLVSIGLLIAFHTTMSRFDRRTIARHS
jgi:exosortase A